MAQLKHEGDKVWLDGVEPLEWGKYHNSVMGSLAAALHAMGDDTGYDYLMGTSGAAFRIQLHKDGWCPSSPHAACGFDCAATVIKSIRYDFVPLACEEKEEAKVAKARADIVKSIDAGRPALYGSEESGVVVGYAAGGKDILIHSYWDSKGPYSILKGWPWGFTLLREKASPPTRTTCLMESLELAVRLARTPEFRNYRCGFAAYERWIADLENDARYKEVDAKEVDQMMLGNAWIYGSLCDARGAAARYLKTIAAEFKGDRGTHVAKAADLYAEIQKVLSDPCPTRVAPYPRSTGAPPEITLKEGETWSGEMRRAQAARLKKALALEREAIAEIAKAIPTSM